MCSDTITLPRVIPADPQVPRELSESYVRSTFAADIVGADPSTIYRHWNQYKTLDGIMVGNTLLVSREQMRWWLPGKPGPKSSK